MREKLTNKGILQACEVAEKYLKKRGCESKELLRIKLSIEEVLICYQQRLGEEAAFTLNTGAGFGRSKIRLTIPGAEADPFTNAGAFYDEDLFIRNVLNQMGKLPRRYYRRGRNEIIFTADKKKVPEWMKLVIAIAAAVLFGFIVRVLPEALRILLRDGIIAPLINTFLGFLNAVAGPMIFLSVVWGIFSIGDTATFSEAGKLLSKKTGLFLVSMIPVVAIVSMPFFHLNFGEGKAGSDFTSLYQMVLDIIPSNLFTLFSRGNTLQILFVAVIMGITMLLVGKNTQTIADLTEQLGFIVNSIMNVVSSLVPLFVFGSLFVIVVSSDFDKLAAGAKFFPATAVGCALLLILHTVVVYVRCKITPVKLWKNSLSTFLIAITTASSSAAFTDNLQTCT